MIYCGQKTKKHRFTLWLALIVAIASISQLYQLDRGLAGLHEYDTAQVSNQAINLVEYGPLRLKFGPAVNLNPLNDKFTYYLYHPFLPNYLFAAIFKLFGSSIVAFRATGIAVFALGAVIFSFFLRKLKDEEFALWGVFFYAFFPISLYAGKFPNIFFPLTFLLLIYYLLWLNKKKTIFLCLALVIFTLNCAVDWYAYFLAPLLIVHFRYIIKDKNPVVFLFPILAAIMLAGFFAYNYYLTGSLFAAQPQWPAVIRDSIALRGENQGLLSHLVNGRMKFDLLLENQFYLSLAGHFFLSFTFVILGLALYFIFNKELLWTFSQSTILACFGAVVYFGYGLLNPKTLIDHVTLLVFLSPTVAAICAAASYRAPRRWQIILPALFLVLSFFNVRTLYSMNNTRLTDLMQGEAIAALTPKGAGVALSEPYYSPFIEYLGRRKFLYDVYSFEKLNYILNSDKIDFFCSGIRDFQSYLAGRHSVVFLPDNYALFDLNRRGTDVPRISTRITFDNNVSLVDYSFKRLPGGFLLADYSWKKEADAIELFKVFVHFENNMDYLFGQDHFIKNGLVDSSGPASFFLRERYLIKMPDAVAGKKLRIFIGLYSPVTFERFKPLNYPSKDNRVYLGAL